MEIFSSRRRHHAQTRSPVMSSVVVLGKRGRSSSAALALYRKRTKSAGAGYRTAYRSIAGRSRMLGGYGPYRTGGFYGASVRSPAERKVIDTANALYAFHTTGSITLLNGIATGTDYTERIGRRVNVTAIQMRGFAYNDIVGPCLVNSCRLMLVLDNQVNGVSATVADILTSVNANSFMNMNNRERFKVLYDKQVTFGPLDKTANQAIAGGTQTATFNCYKKVNIPVVFEGTAATIGSISAGAIYLVCVGSTTPGVGDAILQAQFRIRFIDA